MRGEIDNRGIINMKCGESGGEEERRKEEGERMGLFNHKK